MLFPSTACLVQNGLGARGAWGFDLIAACSGFVYGITTAAHLVAAGTHRKVLVIGADTMSRIIDYTDRSTCVLFGDGAGAMLIEPAEDGEDAGFIDFLGEIDGSGGDFLKMPAGGSRMPASQETVDQRMHYVHQEGQQVFKYAVRKMYESCRDLLARNGLTGDDIAVLIPHQANRRIIEAAAERLGLRAGEGDDQHRPLRQHHRRHHSAGHARCHRAGQAEEGRSGAVRRRRRRIHRRRQSVALGLLGPRRPTFAFQQRPLAPQTPAVAGQFAVASDNPVARDHNRDAVIAIRVSHRPRCRWGCRVCGQIAVGPRFTIRNGPERRPDFLLKRSAADHRAAR